jgi:hypothetical protein
MKNTPTDLADDLAADVRSVVSRLKRNPFNAGSA